MLCTDGDTAHLYAETATEELYKQHTELQTWGGINSVWCNNAPAVDDEVIMVQETASLSNL